MSRIPLGFLPGILRNIGIAWRLMQNPAVSPWIKLLLPLLAVVYYFSPIDLLPGLPFDDLFVVLFVFPEADDPLRTVRRGGGGDPRLHPVPAVRGRGRANHRRALAIGFVTGQPRRSFHRPPDAAPSRF